MCCNIGDYKNKKRPNENEELIFNFSNLKSFFAIIAISFFSFYQTSVS